MGHYVIKNGRNLFVENGVVYACPGGVALPVDAETLEDKNVKEVVAIPPHVEEKTVANEIVVPAPAPDTAPYSEDTTTLDSTKHSPSCYTKGRRGNYTKGCPRCEALKKDK